MSAVEAFYESANSPEPKRGERVKLLRYSNCADRRITHEVRQDRIFGFGLYFESEKDCLRFIEMHDLKRTN